MIFGRKKKKATEETPEAVVADAEADAPVDADETTADDLTDAADESNESAEPETADKAVETAAGGEAGDEDSDADPTAAETQRWADYDLSRDWREDGPFDIEEVDLEADEVRRLDFGSLIVTPLPDCEIRIQVAPDTQQIVSILMVVGDSAIELSAYAAPRTPGLWAETRQQIVDQTLATGGEVGMVEGPFGTEVVRKVYLQAPDGREFVQLSRTWAAEGPRWLLRGILVGRVAQPDAPEELLHPFLDTFADIIVRRGDNPMPQEVQLPLTLPEGVEPPQPAPQA